MKKELQRCNLIPKFCFSMYCGSDFDKVVCLNSEIGTEGEFKA